MKKMFMLLSVFALVIMFMGTSSVMAGGDKNRGEIGVGSTYENNCPDQPCFEDAPMPGPTTLATLAAVPSVVEELDDADAEPLLFIREEEKMARDVSMYFRGCGAIQYSQTLRVLSRLIWML